MLKAVKVDEGEEQPEVPIQRKGSKELEHVNICIEKAYATSGNVVDTTSSGIK